MLSRPPKPPSSSGLGHHPLKVATRVRIPLGVPDEEAGERPSAVAEGLSRSPACHPFVPRRTVAGRWRASDSSLRADGRPGFTPVAIPDGEQAMGHQDGGRDRKAGRSAEGERLGGRASGAGRSRPSWDLRRSRGAVDRRQGAPGGRPTRSRSTAGSSPATCERYTTSMSPRSRPGLSTSSMPS